jgi:hypothetical protein
VLTGEPVVFVGKLIINKSDLGILGCDLDDLILWERLLATVAKRFDKDKADDSDVEDDFDHQVPPGFASDQIGSRKAEMGSHDHEN